MTRKREQFEEFSLFCFSNFLKVDIFGMESLRYWRELLISVRTDKFILAYLYLVNELISNLGKVYSHVKNRQVRKLISEAHSGKFCTIERFRCCLIKRTNKTRFCFKATLLLEAVSSFRFFGGFLYGRVLGDSLIS